MDRAEADRFEQVTTACLADVLRYARALTRDADEAQDLVQETYLRAYRFRDTFESGGDARRWLFRICRNAFLRHRERQRWEVAVEDDAELESLAAVALHKRAEPDSVDDILARIDFGPALQRALHRLPETHRVVFALVDLGEQSYAEAAQSLGVPVGTIRSRLFRARRELQEQLISYAHDAGLGRSLTE